MKRSSDSTDERATKVRKTQSIPATVGRMQSFASITGDAKLKRDLTQFTLPRWNENFAKDEEEAYDDLPTYPDRPHFHEHHLTMKPATQLICFDGAVDDPYKPSSMPLYQTATFKQPGASVFGPYDYTRSGNPTRTALETLVAGLEDAHTAFAFTSGMAALNAVTRVVKAGEEIIASADLYGGMYRLLTKCSARQGIKTNFVDTSNVELVRQAITSNTKLIHLESPSNPLMKITDLRAISQLARERGILVSVDNTMMSPHLQKPIDLGVDIVIHSATKFLSGHADVMAGVVCVKTEELAKEISFYQNAEGTALAPFDCWLLLRSIKTMALRVERAQENAEAVAEFLSRHPAVLKLNYSGAIPNPKNTDPIRWEENKWGVGEGNDAKGVPREVKRVNISSSFQAHKLHMTQSRGGGSVISFETGNADFSRRFADACRLFKITVSFGSVNSLVELPCALSHASIPAEKRTLPEDLVRLAIGVEDVQDILQDLYRAFKCAASNVEDVRSITADYHTIREMSIADIKGA